MPFDHCILLNTLKITDINNKTHILDSFECKLIQLIYFLENYIYNNNFDPKTNFLIQKCYSLFCKTFKSVISNLTAKKS